MNNKKLIKLVETLISIREKLKCPICLDVIQEIVELDCGHKYCNECYLEHKSTQKKLSCPLCKKILKRRSRIYTDKYATALGKFVYNCCENIRSVYKCEVEQLREQLKEGIEVPANKENIPQQNISKDIPLAIPSTSKDTSHKLKQIKEKRNTKKILKKRKENENESAFDKLMNRRSPFSTFNKKGTKRVYTNKKKVDQAPTSEYNILKFDNHENKTAVLQWLHDTRNQFDRLSQTQVITGDDGYQIPFIDLVSVSQVNRKENKRQTVRQPTYRKERAKSLDIEVEKTVPTQKKLNTQTRSVSLENYNIDDNTEEEEVVKKAEEKVILDLIEDELLDTLDDEMQGTRDSTFEITSKRYPRARKKSKPLSPTSTTGWQRLSKMERTIEKTERVPKQLNITLQPTPELKNENKPICSIENLNDSKQNSMINEVMDVENVTEPSIPDKDTDIYKISNVDTAKILTVALIQTDVSKNMMLEAQREDSNKSEKVEIENKSRPPESDVRPDNSIEGDTCKAKKQTYDLEKLEDYLSKNIVIIDKNTSMNSATLSRASQQEKLKPDDQNLDFNIPIRSQPAAKYIANEPIEIVDKNTSMDSATLSRASQQEKLKPDDQNLDFNVLNRSHIGATDIVDEPVEVKNSSPVLVNDLFDMPTQRVSFNNSKSKGENEVVAVENDVPELSFTEPNLQSPTIAGTSNIKKETSLDEIAKMYACPTQKINEARHEIEEGHGSTEGLLHLFEDCLEKCITHLKSVDVVVENHLRSLQFYLSKLKLLQKNDNELVKTRPATPKLCDAETQTIVQVTNKTTQVEVTHEDISVQTEDFHCLKCNDKGKVQKDVSLISPDTITALEHMVNETNIDFKPTLHSTVSNRSVSAPRSEKRSQYEQFTCTLDNLNFDTQDVAKNQGPITKVGSYKPAVAQTSKAAEDSKVEEDVPGSVLVCSLSSDRSATATSKKINRKLTYEADKSSRFKRIKEPASDDDSDEETPAKRKCNRFLRDDLTVEFLTNPDISDDKENKTLAVESQNSEGINYDEYLAEVMRKYEDNDFSNSPSQSFKKPKVLTPKQELKTRCEQMIDNANKLINPTKTVSELSAASSKDSYRTASDSICNNFDDGLASDDVFMNEDNLLKLENDILEYEKNAAQGSEISDIIGETEDIEPQPKKRKTTVKKPDLNLSNKLCNVPEETEAEKLKTQPKLKINILENIKLKSQDRKEDVNTDEDDLFSDEDIVETTPQKKVNRFSERSSHSQIMPSISLIKNALPVPPTEVDSFDFDIVPLPPPPDFQDDIDIPCTPDQIVEDENPSVEDITMIDLNQSSLTPDNLSQFMFRSTKNVPSSHIAQNTTKKDESINVEKENIPEDKTELEDNLLDTSAKLTTRNEPERRNISHSTPVIDTDLTRETLGFSPIAARKSQKMGITEMAQATKYTPLITTAKKETPQKLNLFTSTPRQKSMWNYVRPSQSGDEAAPPVEKAKPRIACTRLTKDQIKSIVKLSNRKLATYNSQFDASVTHMVVMGNDENRVKDYTIKFVSAVAAGLWVVRFEWVEECLKKNCIVPEEPFEVLDISGFPGPRTSRLTRKQDPLFRGYKFFCAEPFLSTTKEEIEDIIKMLGGKVLPDLKYLRDDDGNIGIIIGEGHATQDFEQYEKWVEMYKTVTVDIEWLSKCVGQYKILSIRPFIWCSEDNIGDLGYPSILTETVRLSFAETF